MKLSKFTPTALRKVVTPGSALLMTLMAAPATANAQSAFGNLCAVYNTYFSANSQLIGFGLSIMIIVSLVAYFTSEEKRGIISVVASIAIIAGVVMMFPQILSTMGFTTC